MPSERSIRQWQHRQKTRDPGSRWPGAERHLKFSGQHSPAHIQGIVQHQSPLRSCQSLHRSLVVASARQEGRLQMCLETRAAVLMPPASHTTSTDEGPALKEHLRDAGVEWWCVSVCARVSVCVYVRLCYLSPCLNIGHLHYYFEANWAKVFKVTGLWVAYWLEVHWGKLNTAGLKWQAGESG